MLEGRCRLRMHIWSTLQMWHLKTSGWRYDNWAHSAGCTIGPIAKVDRSWRSSWWTLLKPSRSRSKGELMHKAAFTRHSSLTVYMTEWMTWRMMLKWGRSGSKGTKRAKSGLYATDVVMGLLWQTCCKLCRSRSGGIQMRKAASTRRTS